MNNSNLHNAQKAKKDEFYTKYETIKKELEQYFIYNNKVFENKIIYCCCDGKNSNFKKYFIDNFSKFKLKKLICTGYKQNGKGYLFIKTDTQETETNLNNDGDFHKQDKYFNECDFIITNPPFSLWRDFFNFIIKYDKKIIIMGTLAACVFLDVFPYIKNKKIWLGHSIHSNSIEFTTPDYYIKTLNKYKIKNGVPTVKIGNIRWYTNVEHGKQPQPLQLETMENNLKNNKRLQLFLKKRNKKNYFKFDNIDALEIPTYTAIPKGYNDLMGVPVSFFDYWNYEQFEVVGFTNTMGKGKITIDGAEVFKRVFIRPKMPIK